MNDLRRQIVGCKNPDKLPVSKETIAEMLAVIWDLQDALSRSQHRFESAATIVRQSAEYAGKLVEDYPCRTCGQPINDTSHIVDARGHHYHVDHVPASVMKGE